MNTSGYGVFCSNIFLSVIFKIFFPSALILLYKGHDLLC